MSDEWKSAVRGSTRLVAGGLLAALGLLTVVPQPDDAVWQLSLLVGEWGHWLAIPALLLVPGVRRSGIGAVGAVLAALGVALLLLPLAQALAISRGLPEAMTTAFGTSEQSSLSPGSAGGPRDARSPEPMPSANARSISPLGWGPAGAEGGRGARASEGGAPRALNNDKRAGVRGTHAAPLDVSTLLLGVDLNDDELRLDQHVYATIDGEELALDLYRPADVDRPAPVVIVIHGGSWQNGSRAEFAALNRHLSTRGYAVAAIDYRLAPRSLFPAAQEDVAAAILYIKEIAGRAHLDPDRMALLGRSAGGHIALVAGYTLHEAAIRGVISFYGPAAMRWGHENPARPGVIDSTAILERYLGGPPATHGAQYDAAEPARFIDPSSPPTLFIQGLRDELVSPFHAEFVSARLIEAGVPHFILRLPWAVHGCDYVFRGPCGQLSTYAVERFLEAVM